MECTLKNGFIFNALSETIIDLRNIFQIAVSADPRYVPHSTWNQARRAGKIAVIDTGPMKHTGRGDYFDRKAKLPSGQIHADKTADIVSGVIADTLDGQIRESQKPDANIASGFCFCSVIP
ncbi:MAG: hypothetical protein B6243_06830 [Anaerolineaceae bacterium 4572_5.2]|nr:MAG: hypothetical protein B6243_06830 [Anaerolineaceae bacterium 4572_5.2]